MAYSLTLKLPIRMKVNKKGVMKPLNLNAYRNLHYRSTAYQKIAFFEHVRPMLKGLPKLKLITLDYVIYPKTHLKFDVANVGSILDKYFSDSLTHMGVIPDDNYLYLPRVSYAFGSVTPKGQDGYALVTITDISDISPEPITSKSKPNQERPKQMKIILEEAEIQEALVEYVSSLGIENVKEIYIQVAGKPVTTELTADIITGLPVAGALSTMDTPEEEEAAPTPKKRIGRPKGAKNKPKVAAAQETDEDEENDPDLAINSAGGTDPEAAGFKKVSMANIFSDKETKEDKVQKEEEPVSSTPKGKSIFDL